MKKWTPGVADEAWKIMVCAKDAAHADDVISFLVYILTNAGNDQVAGLAELRSKSGDEIVAALIQYQAVAHQTVRNGLSNK
jgi:hypothetical protein